MASATITPQIFRIFIGPLLKVKIDWLILESTTVALFIVLQLSLKCYTSSQSSSGIFCIACNFLEIPFCAVSNVSPLLAKSPRTGALYLRGFHYMQTINA